MARAVELVNEGRFEHLGLFGPAVVEPVPLDAAKDAVELLIGSVINCVPSSRGTARRLARSKRSRRRALAMRGAIEADFDENHKELTRVPTSCSRPFRRNGDLCVRFVEFVEFYAY